MRTTVTIDPDTEALLREEIKASGKSFKRVLNEAVQASLRKERRSIEVKPIAGGPFPIHPEGANFNRLADEWDDEERIEKLNKR